MSMTPEVFKAKAIDSLTSFDPGLVLRGAQLTFVGAYRALQNPNLFQSRHYKQAATAVLAGLALRLIIDFPILIIKIFLFVSSFFVDFTESRWDDKVLHGISFVEKNVLQIPFFLMTIASAQLTNALDEVFMESLNWVDQTYNKKHPESKTSAHPRGGIYHQNLVLWDGHKNRNSNEPIAKKLSPKDAFIQKQIRKGIISLIVYVASLVPWAGKVVLPAVSAYSLHEPAGIGPSAVVFLVGLAVPRKRMIIALQAYYASRSLVRQLLEPYFSRVSFTTAQKKKWFRERQGVLLGFGIGFYMLMRIPLMGVLVYGIAEASTAYLITKITDPPPHPSQGAEFAASQAEWHDRRDFEQFSWKIKDGVGKLKERIQLHFNEVPQKSE